MRNIKWLARHVPGVRGASVLLLLIAGVMALGARCIDRTSTYVDSDGYTHITGEMANETTIQGTRINVLGTLFDANNNVVAQKVAPTCPPDLQGNTEISFDIRFDNPSLPPWTRYEVRPISGVTLSSPLPDPHVVLFHADAARFVVPPVIPGFPITDKDVLFAFELRNQTDTAYDGAQMCAAVLDQAGNFVLVTSDELVSRTASGGVTPAIIGPQALGTVYGIARNVPKGPVQVRAWIWFGQKGAPTSQYQYVTTGLVTIRTISAP